MKKYKISSENTTKYIDLHDCICSHLHYKNKKLIFEMEWMEILSSHPLNTYNEAHQSSEGIIELKSPIILNIETYKYNGDKIESPELKNFNFYNLEINDYDEFFISKEYSYITFYGSNGNKDEEYDYITFDCLFKGSTVKWDELKNISWFENKIFKKKIDQNEILKMLSKNNSKEIQKQGIELSSSIRHLGFFFQPLVENTKKSTWKNCALILFNKSDEVLKPWLLNCFLWLQDMKNPGANIIKKRLINFKDKEVLKNAKNEALKIANIMHNDLFIESIKKIN